MLTRDVLVVWYSFYFTKMEVVVYFSKHCKIGIRSGLQKDVFFLKKR